MDNAYWRFAMGAALAAILTIAMPMKHPRADAADDFEACKTIGGRGNAKAALAPCTRAIEAGTLRRRDQAMAYGIRGWLYVDQHDLESALKDFDQAIALMPNAAIAYAARGTVYVYLGNFAASLRDLDKSIALNPTDGEAYMWRGRSYGGLGEFARAIQDLDKAAELAPDNAEIYKARGGAKSALKEYAASIPDFTTALRLDPKDAAVWAYRGLSYLQLGDAARALPDLNQAIALNPQSIDARAGRAYADLATGDYEAAIEDYSESIRIKPEAEFHVALGIAYVMRKDGASAMRALEAATALHSDNESIPLWLILAGGEVPAGATTTESWPAPLLGYARGSLSEKQVLASTFDRDPAKQAQRQCQAHFYMGALDQRSGRAAAAKRHLTQAAEECSNREIEAAAAKEMLATM